MGACSKFSTGSILELGFLHVAVKFGEGVLMLEVRA